MKAPSEIEITSLLARAIALVEQADKEGVYDLTYLPDSGTQFIEDALQAIKVIESPEVDAPIGTVYRPQSFTRDLTLGMTCKPESLEEIQETDHAHLKAWAGETARFERINTLMSDNASIDLEALDSWACISNSAGFTHFVLISADRDEMYLVSTEGYSYARYISRVEQCDCDALIPLLETVEYFRNLDERVEIQKDPK